MTSLMIVSRSSSECVSGYNQGEPDVLNGASSTTQKERVDGR